MLRLLYPRLPLIATLQSKSYWVVSSKSSNVLFLVGMPSLCSRKQ